MGIKFYQTASGKSPVLDFVKELPEGIHSDFFDAVSMLDEGEMLGMPNSKSLSTVHANLHELRFRNGPALIE